MKRLFIIQNETKEGIASKNLEYLMIMIKSDKKLNSSARLQARSLQMIKGKRTDLELLLDRFECNNIKDVYIYSSPIKKKTYKKIKRKIQ